MGTSSAPPLDWTVWRQLVRNWDVREGDEGDSYNAIIWFGAEHDWDGDRCRVAEWFRDELPETGFNIAFLDRGGTRSQSKGKERNGGGRGEMHGDLDCFFLDCEEYGIRDRR